MSNESSAKIGAARRDWKTEHQAMYLESGGARGHIVDLSDIGAHAFTPTLLLRYVGRKSGKTRITPLIYGVFGGEVVIVASKGGADDHPAWYLNLRDGRESSIQIASQAFRTTSREARGAERARVWDYMVGVYPPYKDYQASTQREIPIVMLSPKEPVAVFEG
jgi:deazaflavin-dependent oxidoreductase (nitroreductase family)